MTFASPQPIAPEPAVPGGYSLLVAATQINSDYVDPREPEQPERVRWAGGVEWQPERDARAIPGAMAMDISCLGNTPEGLDADGVNAGQNVAFPFLLTAFDRCSSYGWQAHDYTGRATRALENMQSMLVAQQLQVDEFGLGNASLEQATPATPNGSTPLDGLAVLEGAASSAYGGRKFMIHATPQSFTYLKASQAIYLSGQRWVTAMGNVVAADPGYRAIDDVEKMYATLPIVVRLGAVEIFPGDLAQALDRSTNTITYRAQRLALVTFDSAVLDEGPDLDLIFSVQIDLTPWALPAVPS